MSRYWAHFISGGVVAIVAILAANAAHAEKARLIYNVYAGGMNVIVAPLDVEITGTSYKMSLGAQTRGFLGTMVPWQGSFAAKGARTKDQFSVREYRSTATWKGEDDTAVYSYDAKGQFKNLKLTEGTVDKSPSKIDTALVRDTTDILTATLNVMAKADQTNKCAGSADVFDSRRRFTLKYSPAGADTLKASRYTTYQGPAMKCTVEVIPKGGAWHKKPRGWLSIQEQGRKQGTLPTLWVAKVDPRLPPMPVKILIKTDYGTLIMHMAGVQK